MIKEKVNNVAKKVKEHVVENRGFYGYCAGLVVAGALSQVAVYVHDKSIVKGNFQIGYHTREGIEKPIIIREKMVDKKGREMESWTHTIATDKAENFANDLLDAVNKRKEIENG